MKQLFIPRIAIAGLLFLAVPSSLLAQKEKEDKAKNNGEAEQIIITRRGSTDGKTVIELNGDQVKINGKDAAESKDGDITVRRNKVRDYRALAQGRGPGSWNMNLDDNSISLFSEDSNRAMLGVATEESEKGAKVVSVNKESAAEKAGLKVGDIITRIDDQKIEDAEDVADAVHEHKPGDKVAITVLRDGKEQKLNAELSKWKGVRITGVGPYGVLPPEAPMPPMTFNFRGNGFNMGGGPRLGLSIQDTEDGKGVKVMDVDEESAAAKAGLKEGDIITQIDDKVVNSTDEVTRLVRESRDKTSLQMKVLRKGKAQTLEVRVPRKLKSADL